MEGSVIDTSQQLSFLPNAEHWPLIDYAVRLWASPHGFAVERDEHQATERRIVVDRFRRHGHVLVTVHVPEAHHPCRVTKLTVDELEVR